MLSLYQQNNKINYSDPFDSYEQNSTVVTTNRPFGEWNEVFPNASCVVSLIDRLVHHSQIIAIEGDSYRMKEAQEQATKRCSIKKGSRK